MQSLSEMPVPPIGIPSAPSLPLLALALGSSLSFRSSFSFGGGLLRTRVRVGDCTEKAVEGNRSGLVSANFSTAFRWNSMDHAVDHVQKEAGLALRVERLFATFMKISISTPIFLDIHKSWMVSSSVPSLCNQVD